MLESKTRISDAHRAVVSPVVDVASCLGMPRLLLLVTCMMPTLLRAAGINHEKEARFSSLARDMFHGMDTDGSGALSWEEMEPMLSSPPAKADGIVRMLWHLNSCRVSNPGAYSVIAEHGFARI